MNVISNGINLFPIKKSTVSSIRFGSLQAASNFDKKPNNDTFEKKVKVFKEDKNGQLIEAKPYNIHGFFSSEDFLDKLKYENPQSKYIKFDDGKYTGEEITDNKEAQAFVKTLEGLSSSEQADFVKVFCAQTGFPDLEKVRSNMEKEVVDAIHTLAQEKDFEVKFIGYDRNCSLGRGVALPGSDIDALFMIIDGGKDKPEWFPGAIRWQFKDAVDQRLVGTPAGHLPEVLSTTFIEDGLEFALDAYNSIEFQEQDKERFRENLKDDSNDFVKSAEFNIRLAKELPCDKAIRDKFYKTSMFVELVREGVILENNFSKDFINKIKSSPLYKYSNVMKMQGLSNKPKQKHLDRLNLVKSFDELNPKEQFCMIKEIIYSLYNIKTDKNTKLFTNADASGNNEMGNILEMYNLLKTAK